MHDICMNNTESLDDLKKEKEQLERQNEELKEKMKKIGVIDMIEKEVKAISKSAHIYVPKEYIGKRAVVFVFDDEVANKETTPQNETSSKH